MGIWRSLFGRRGASRDDQIVNLVRQAQAAVDSSIGHDGYMRLLPPIESLWTELLQSNPEHTAIRIQAVVCAVAKFVGLHVWSECGNRLSNARIIQLAQGMMILELANQFLRLTPGGAMRELFGQLLAEQRLARQASSPVVLAEMGQQAEARRIVAEMKRIALLPDDAAIDLAIAALQHGPGE